MRVPRVSGSPFGNIEVRGARENNLNDISLDIPRRKITAFTALGQRQELAALRHSNNHTRLQVHCGKFLMRAINNEPQHLGSFELTSEPLLYRKHSERFGIIAEDHCRPGGSVKTIDPNNP